MNNLRFSYSYSPYDNLMGYGKSSGRNETDGKYVWGSGFGNGIGQCSEEHGNGYGDDMNIVIREDFGVTAFSLESYYGGYGHGTADGHGNEDGTWWEGNYMHMSYQG
jgi:hypothetical protein